MALEYTLNLDGAFLADDLLTALAGAGFAPVEGADDAVAAAGAIATVGATSDRFGRYAAAFGFSPSSNVLFAIDQRDDYEPGMRAMLGGVAAILAALPDDAVLVANHDTALLLRRDGQVTLTDRDAWWTSGLTPPPRDALPVPFGFATLPVF